MKKALVRQAPIRTILPAWATNPKERGCLGFALWRPASLARHPRSLDRFGLLHAAFILDRQHLGKGHETDTFPRLI
jgi:hypothetical protein